VRGETYGQPLPDRRVTRLSESFSAQEALIRTSAQPEVRATNRKAYSDPTQVL